jgi:hypothetical protein
MRMLAIVIAVLVVLGLAGCGNVYLRGDALTAAETSTMDAYQAVERAAPQREPDCPAWLRAYLEENFRQWRFFVRSARKDLTWGPKLEAERPAGSE